MAKKLKAVIDDDSLANAVRASAAQIWQAGLGAFAKAQEEGSRVFSKLVKDGAELQKDGRLPGQQPGTADKLEQVFEERVARALATIGVPGQAEVAALERQVERLTQQVAALAAALESRPAAPARKAPPAANAKPAPAAKAVAKKAARKTAARKA
jgi:polyhydroxyalkanoate synthesis regulator phasin